MAYVLSLTIRAPLIISSLAILAAVLLVFPGCTDPLAHENDELRKEIILVHDEAMEKIGLLYELQNRIKRETGKSAGSSTEPEAYIDALQQADETMFAWMRQYRTLAVDNDLAKDTRYRREQLELIREVQRLMEKAIDQAETYLKKPI